MPLMGRACQICSPRTLCYLLRRDSYSLYSPQKIFLNRPFPALSLSQPWTLQLRRMSTGNSPPDIREEPTPKRRKIVRASSPRFIQPYKAMATQSNSDSPQLELTELESKLRQLLLDVAAYIDSAKESEKKVTDVEVPENLKNEKIILRWTGGWVRDKLLGVESHDIDLAINKMTGEHFGLKMQEYLEIPGNAEKHGLIKKSEATDKLSGQDKSKKIAPGLHKIEANPEKSKNLETATTKIMGIDLDLVNLRKETYNEISRNPEMEFGTAEEDAMRRDATVNAMFYNLHTCQVEDFTNRGFEDMAVKIIRTPLEPYQTFKDDPLRVLRLIRFASRLDYIIEPETAKAMGNPDIQKVLKIKISRERVGIELEKMLKGPRPRMALELIDRFGLYETVFTDPTRELNSEPEISYFTPACNFTQSLTQNSDGLGHPNISETLLRGSEEHYLAWICATLVPWADAPKVPHPKPTQRPFYAAYLVAREGFKAPNKVCDVITASLNNGEEIRSLVTRCSKGVQHPSTVNAKDDATARDTLGMAIRRWGSSWRTQVLFSLTYEIVLGQVSREQILTSYSVFLDHLRKLEILDADTFKPLLNGKDLAKALNTKPGPWMKDALDVVMAWQLLNPDITDPSEAIEAVKDSRNSELPSRLASQFLQLTIPPFFPQNNHVSTNNSSITPTKRLWKEPGNQYVLDLLEWVVSTLDGGEIEKSWRLLVPPVLQVVDDMESQWKARGCRLINLLLKPFAPPNSSAFLVRTGYDNVFAETLWPLFTYLPSLTPENESILLFHEVFPALTALGLALPNDRKDQFLDKLLREGVLSTLSHFPTPSTYPELATTIVSELPDLLGYMQVRSVKHLNCLLPLLTAILQEPFVLSHQPLMLATLKALQSIILNGWPRMIDHRGTIMLGVCTAWGRCVDDVRRSSTDIASVKAELQETVAMLDAVLTANEKVNEAWTKEKQDVIEASAAYHALFETCAEDG